MTTFPNFPCPPAAIIFDMDGTLVDSERLWKKAETAMLAQHGITYSSETHAPFIGMALREFLPNLCKAYGISTPAEELRIELVQRVLDVVAESPAMPGAFELVEFVASRGIPYAIASSSPMPIIHGTLASQPAWADRFTVRCSADEVAHGKPAPDVYLLAAQRLGVDPTQCIAIEDSRNGSKAAVAAGMTCFTVPDLSHASPADFAHITPFIFESLHHVLDALEPCYER
jgi:beta-phosphoglucomutase-like phosphatase (HAD superfamily)